jgi:hypothetical protein
MVRRIVAPLAHHGSNTRFDILVFHKRWNILEMGGEVCRQQGAHSDFVNLKTH